MLNDKVIIKASSLSFLHRVSFALFGLFNFILIIRILEKDDFGVWILYISVTAIIESVRKAFIYNPLVKYLSSSKENEYHQVVNSSLYLNIISSMIISVVLYILAIFLSCFWNSPAIYNGLLIYIFINIFYIIILHFTSIAEANMDFSITLFGFLFQKVLFFVLVYTFYLFFDFISVYSLFYMHFFSVLFSMILTLFLSGKYFIKLSKIDFIWIRKHFNFGIYTFGTNISSMLYKNTDSLMLGSMISSSAVAIYNPAIRISSFYEIPLGVLSSIIYPKISRDHKKNELSSKILFEKSVGFILVIFIPITILTLWFSKDLVIFIAGLEYIDSVPLLRITLLYGLLLPFNRQFGIIMNGIGKPRINFQVMLLGAVINLILNYYLILCFGIVGAAYATLISYIIIVIIGQILLHRLLKINTLYVFFYIYFYFLSFIKLLIYKFFKFR